MRAPRLALFASAAALLTAAGAYAQTPYEASGQTAPSAAPAPAADFTDEELRKYDAAITRVRAVSDTLNGAQPTPEQQAEMAAAVQDSGLEVVRFNAISTAAAESPVINARINAMKAPKPAPGSVAAGVSDAELRQFVEAMTQIRAVTANVQNGQATPEQSAQLTAAVEGSGLAVDRFNAVATAVSQDPGLRARAELIGAQQQEAGAQ
ncbi:MAG: hypothetical protein Q7J26_13615 [Brevundimonas sp.]|uniref:hypothetical protein n=1 Tax=Brevundimonas sp. TaxID=1871086 RepID=UPI00272483C0|nr:hypothetical protein [Brevundimonas sp.]MDO9609555.1 hypothetical protein [Brevundimonas sp.]